MATGSNKLNPILFTPKKQTWLSNNKIQIAGTVVENVGNSKQDTLNYFNKINYHALTEQLKAYKNYHNFSLFHTENYIKRLKGSRRIIKQQNIHLKSFKRSHNFA